MSAAWALHQSELRGWLRHRLGEATLADDLLQDLFLKALRQGERFCAVQNAHAWLFEVARNTVELPEDLVATVDELDTVDTLCVCLPRVLSELNTDDREAIALCNLQGMLQAQFAQFKGLSLSASKSRLRRARLRLRQRLTEGCQVQLNATGRVSDFVPRALL